MKKLLIGLAAVPFLAGIAMAGQPKPLTDAQMDKVSAGGVVTEFELGSQFEVTVNWNVRNQMEEFGPDVTGAAVATCGVTAICHAADPVTIPGGGIDFGSFPIFWGNS